MTPGSTFGDYKVVRCLGKGGMGEVWLLEGKSGRQVAAKILDAGADHESRKRFLREAQLALGVKHPNLVETYDVGEDPDSGLCYILMEYVPGGTLADYIKASGALAIEDAVAVVEAIAGVLELGRQKGIVHRDIKPANIMFDAEGTPKLADLGIARAGNAGTETTTVTQTGAIIGTPAYMSPEQMFDAHNVDSRADIYSLGVVFFEMLTGQRPNKNDTVVQLMARAMAGEPLPDVRTLCPEVPDALAELVRKMVEPDRANRIATPAKVVHALSVIGSTALVPIPPTEVLPVRRRHRERAPVALGLLTCVALTVWKYDLLDKGKEILPKDWRAPEVDVSPNVSTNSPPDPIRPKPVIPKIIPEHPFSITILPAITPSNVLNHLEVTSPEIGCLKVCPACLKPCSPRWDATMPYGPPPEFVCPKPTVCACPYECEFVPHTKGFFGKTHYPAKIDSIEVKACSTSIVRRVRNKFGGESAVVAFGGWPLDVCFLTIAAEGKSKTVPVQLLPEMPMRVEVNLSE